MNVILPKISNTFFQTTSAVSSVGYSFNKQAIGQNPGHTSLNNSAVSIINAYFTSLAKKKETINNSFTAVYNTQEYKHNSINADYLISKPTFSHTNNKVTIQVFYYVSGLSDFDNNNEDITGGQSISINQKDSFKNSLTGLSTTLAQLYQKEVNLVVIRLYYPYLNSYILSQYLAHNAVSNTFMDFQESILTNPSLHKTNLPAHICGIKVQVSGRLVTETVVPRVTVKSCLIGSFNSTNNPSQFIDYSKFTTKNELGAFTVKVWICQRP